MDRLFALVTNYSVTCKHGNWGRNTDLCCNKEAGYIHKGITYIT